MGMLTVREKQSPGATANSYLLCNVPLPHQPTHTPTGQVLPDNLYGCHSLSLRWLLISPANPGSPVPEGLAICRIAWD